MGLLASDACDSRDILKLLQEISWRDPGFNQNDSSPVVCVSWDDAMAYVKWLARVTGKPYRLLSEAEWEYAARAKTDTAFYFGDRISTEQANYNSLHSGELSVDQGNRGKTIRVGSFDPNGFGLHDMHGNVLEWVEDCWHENYKNAPTDGRAWTWQGNCSLRVVRGGSWFNHAGFSRSSFRGGLEEDERYTHYGLRVARAIEPEVLLSELASAPAK